MSSQFVTEMSDTIYVNTRGWLTLHSKEDPDLKSLVKSILIKTQIPTNYENKYLLIALLTNMLVNLSKRPSVGKITKKSKRGAEIVNEYRWNLEIKTFLKVKFNLFLAKTVFSSENFTSLSGHQLKWNFTSIINSLSDHKPDYFPISNSEENHIRELLKENYPAMMRKPRFSQKPIDLPSSSSPSAPNQSIDSIASTASASTVPRNVTLNWGHSKYQSD
nr:MAG: hypothetical protein [Wufeng shrew rhabdovirus 2]